LRQPDHQPSIPETSLPLFTLQDDIMNNIRTEIIWSSAPGFIGNPKPKPKDNKTLTICEAFASPADNFFFKTSDNVIFRVEDFYLKANR
jgi:hypothetical protein